jgi:hypothetical protein
MTDDLLAETIPHDERRANPRHAPVKPWGRVAWKTGRPPFQSAPAQLIDITEGGAQILTSALPPGLRRVWVRIDALPWEWVGATVEAVQNGRGRQSQCRLHLSFNEPCPAGLLERAFVCEPVPTPESEPDTQYHAKALSMSLLFELD